MLCFRVHAGPHPRRNCPVNVVMPMGSYGHPTLLQQPGNRPRACQLLASRDGMHCHWLVQRLEPNEECEYHLIFGSRRRGPVPRFRWRELEEAGLQLHGDGKPLLRLDCRPEEPFPYLADVRPGFVSNAAPLIRRLFFRWPVHGAPHQATHGQIQPDPVGGAVLAQAGATGDAWNAEGHKLGRQLLQCRVYGTPTSLCMIDIEVTLQATAGPILFEPTSVTSFLNIEMAAEPNACSEAESSAGLREIHALQGHPAAWLHCWGQQGSITCLTHPTNPGFAPRWQLDLPLRIGATPFADLSDLARLHIPPRARLVVGDRLCWRYRLTLDDSRLDAEALRERFVDFVSPPRVEVREE